MSIPLKPLLDSNLINFGWGGRSPATGLDCIGLVDYLRQKHGQAPIDMNLFSWVYQKYPTLESSPLQLVEELGRIYLDDVASPIDFDCAIITNNSGRSCLGTYYQNRLCFFAGSQAIERDIARVTERLPLRWCRWKPQYLL